jgi:hypothetical protein
VNCKCGLAATCDRSDSCHYSEEKVMTSETDNTGGDGLLIRFSCFLDSTTGDRTYAHFRRAVEVCALCIAGGRNCTFSYRVVSLNPFVEKICSSERKRYPFLFSRLKTAISHSNTNNEISISFQYQEELSKS